MPRHYDLVVKLPRGMRRTSAIARRFTLVGESAKSVADILAHQDLSGWDAGPIVITLIPATKKRCCGEVLAAARKEEKRR